MIVRELRKQLLPLILVFVTIVVLLAGPEMRVQANVSIPEISGSRYLSTYTYASSGKVYAYTSASLSKKTGGYIDCATDECRIKAVKGNAVKVSYPVKGGRKTAWFARDRFTYRDLTKDAAKTKFVSKKKITTYKWKKKNDTFGYVSSGDICYLLRGDASSDWLQIIYPTGNTYKMAWVKGKDSRDVIWPPTTKAVSLNSTSVNLTGAGSTFTFKAAVTPANSTQSVTWNSSDKSVATVNKGVVTAVGPGKTNITATSGSARASATVTVTVKQAPAKVKPSGISLNSGLFTLNGNNAKKQLKATVSPRNASDKSVTWSSSNKKIATVSKNGLVKPVSNGTCTIKAKTSNGKTASVKVKCKNINTVLYYPLKGKVTRSSSCKTNGQYCDYKASSGTPIYAPADGKVKFRQTIAKNHNKLASYGNSVLFISDDGKYTVMCAHLSSFKNVSLECKKSLPYPCSSAKYTCITNVLKTRTVKKGEVIGYAGHTGNASGSHVHIEVKYEGKAKSPASVFKTW